MLNEAIRDEGDILITRLSQLQRGPNFKWMWKLNYAEREQDTWHHGADYLEGWGGGKGMPKNKTKETREVTWQKIHKTAGKCKRSITSWSVGWTCLSRENRQISPISNFRNSLFSFLQWIYNFHFFSFKHLMNFSPFRFFPNLDFYLPPWSATPGQMPQQFGS